MNLDGANLVGARILTGSAVPAGYRGVPSRVSRCGTDKCCMEDCLVIVRDDAKGEP